MLTQNFLIQGVWFHTSSRILIQSVVDSRLPYLCWRKGTCLPGAKTAAGQVAAGPDTASLEQGVEHRLNKAVVGSTDGTFAVWTKVCKLAAGIKNGYCRAGRQ